MFGGDNERNIDIFGVFNGGAATVDDLNDVMEEEETQVANEQLVEDTKNRAQQVAQSNALPPSATIAANKRSYDTDATMTEATKRYRTEGQQPIVADTFEEQTSREVANIAGLQGAPVLADKQITLSHQVRHQVAVPSDYDYTPISQHVRPKDPARTYPFTLDPFQSTSIACIERNESVLVSAHTSAGKTVIAEYAIAQCLKNKQRVIYTSPIKALSNQKYREFTEEFSDVGLLTGDVTINPQASCLVMTTEILRSMLYRGSEIMREVAWIVFDEIHYMRDSERGVVWEESIILLPHVVRYVFLSATIPNARQFAEWICKLHNQPCHVVYTDFRPTPLQHYLFPEGGDGIHLVVDENGHFKEDNFRRALASISDKQDIKSKGVVQSNKQGSTNGATDGPSDIYRIVKMIIMKSYHPVIVFSFSKRECEANAMQMSKLELNTASERDMVDKVFYNAIAPLSKSDRSLPQIQQLQPIIRRGVGVHHGGLLPIMKEIIEVLFQEGLIKILFATETFSIGLNMPAKTVVFTKVSKFDGKERRWLGSGEYVQMSGRAGRRGLDERGVVIMMIDQKLDPDVAKGMIMGDSDPMNSAFRLSYNMVLNLLRVEGISPEYMLQRCFFTFQNDMNLPILERDLANAEEQRDSIKLKNEEEILSYYEIRKQIDILAEGVRAIMSDPSYSLQFMQPGRLVRIRYLDMDFGWGVVVSYHRLNPRKASNGTDSADQEYILDVLLYCDKNSSLSKNADGKTVGVKPALPECVGKPLVVPVSLSSLDGISHIRMSLPNRLKSPESRDIVYKMILDIQSRFHNRMPLLDPIRNMKISDPRFQTQVEKIFVLEAKLMSHPLNQNPDLPYLYNTYARKAELIQKCKTLKRQVGDARSIIQLDELKARKRVLRRLGFTSQGDVVDIKGRVACEITTGDELMLTEMVFQNVFNDLFVDQCVALLSCFVFDEKTQKKSKLQGELEGPLRIIQDTARQIGSVALECKMNIDIDAYVGKFNPGLMDVVYAWCRGATFAQICNMTEVYEGSLIRVFRRLEELLKEMVAAARSIGNAELESKFAEGIKRIHRDIIFAASLYL